METLALEGNQEKPSEVEKKTKVMGANLNRMKFMQHSYQMISSFPRQQKRVEVGAEI